MENQVVLTPSQATAYWWINRIREVARNIFLKKNSYTESEVKFAQIFSNYTEKEWGDIYLQLAEYIKTDVTEYELNKSRFSTSVFSQNTALGGHQRLNAELKEITSKNIPDIVLYLDSISAETVCTNNNIVKILRRQYKPTKLNTTFDTNYILTGDKKILEFYNQFLTAVNKVYEIDKNFNDLNKLKKVFCEEYKALNKSDQSIEELEILFESILKLAKERKILTTGGDKTNCYCSHICKFDIVWLESYTDISEHYAGKILNKPIPAQTVYHM